MTTAISADAARVDHDDYRPMLDAVREHFAGFVIPGGALPLFTTDVDGDALWAAFLGALPEDQRRQHTCHACRRFVQSYGGLVTLDENGSSLSAIFGRAPGIYEASFAAAAAMVRRARVAGVFVSSATTLGTPHNEAKNNPLGWRHMSIVPPPALVYRGVVKTAEQVAAEKAEDYAMLCRALADFDQATLTQALAIVGSEALYRGEKVLGHLRWIADLHARRAELRGPARDNVAWRAVATAPAGFCHVRSSMVGTLLEDVAAGLSFESVKRKFGEKMNPLQYRRPTAPPSAGNIAQAEKVVAALAASGALERRFARLADLRPVWTPEPPKPKEASGGVFAHLQPAEARPSFTPIVAPAMSWEKFARVALPEAAKMECFVPDRGNFLAFVTATNPEAPPILQWDREDERNPVSWYVYPRGSAAGAWGMVPRSYVAVTAISFLPFQWPPAVDYGNHGAGVVFVLAGCRDGHNSSLSLFPETLRSEFHPIRAVIEAHSRSGKLSGQDEADACGLEIRKGGEAHTVKVRVTAKTGVVTDYSVDRWD